MEDISFRVNLRLYIHLDRTFRIDSQTKVLKYFVGVNLRHFKLMHILFYVTEIFNVTMKYIKSNY